MKKKLWAGILAAALVFSICSTTALAAPQHLGCRGRYDADGTCASFVDENGDGICDNFASGACGGHGCGGGLRGGVRLRDASCQGHIAADGTWAHCVDADSDGVCDTCGTAISLGAGFVDEDNDGICDNFNSGIRGGGGTGRQRGHHGGRGR